MCPTGGSTVACTHSQRPEILWTCNNNFIENSQVFLRLTYNYFGSDICMCHMIEIDQDKILWGYGLFALLDQNVIYSF